MVMADESWGRRAKRTSKVQVAEQKSEPVVNEAADSPPTIADTSRSGNQSNRTPKLMIPMQICARGATAQ